VRTKALLVIPVLGATLVACAGSAATDEGVPVAGSVAADPAAADSGTTREVDPRDDGLELGFGEFAITLEAPEIRPGPVTFVVRNGGALVHGFEIEAEDGDDDHGHGGSGHGGLKFEGPAMQPGDVVRLDADLAPGVYTIECFVDGHDDLGMETQLIVRDGAPLATEGAGVAPGEVSIAGFAFAPDTVEVPTGTEITWSNDDPTAHTVTASNGAFDSGALDSGASFSFVADRPGRFTYTCQIHPAMRGVVVVGP
jgi:plastocyanin/uncharacterized cupredoxin-like copper-binding protein